MYEKYLIFIIIKIIFVNSENNTNKTYDYESEIDYEAQGEEMFKISLKEYLTINNIYGNETLEITPEHMKKIFIGVMTGDDVHNIPEEYKMPFKQLIAEFINEQYNQNNRTVIKGSEVYNLLNIKNIADKFNAILEKEGFYNSTDEDNNINIDNIINRDL